MSIDFCGKKRLYHSSGCFCCEKRYETKRLDVIRLSIIVKGHETGSFSPHVLNRGVEAKRCQILIVKRGSYF